MSKETIFTTYNQILNFAGMVSNKEGFVFISGTEPPEPAMINGKQLVLPTDEMLKGGPNSDNRVKFHPLSEEVLNAESDVIRHLAKSINIRLNTVVCTLALQLLHLAGSAELHKNLSPDQATLLRNLPDVDAKTVKEFSSIILKGIKTAPASFFCNIYL